MYNNRDIKVGKRKFITKIHIDRTKIIHSCPTKTEDKCKIIMALSRVRFEE